MSRVTTSAPPDTGRANPPDELREFAVQGRLDGAALLKLREQVAEATQDGPATILVNISGVKLVTASGMAGLLELLRLTRSRGGDLRLYGISLAMADAQEATMLTSITRVYVTREKAVAGDWGQSTAERQTRRGRRADQAATTDGGEDR